MTTQPRAPLHGHTAGVVAGHVLQGLKELHFSPLLVIALVVLLLPTAWHHMQLSARPKDLGLQGLPTDHKIQMLRRANNGGVHARWSRLCWHIEAVGVAAAVRIAETWCTKSTRRELLSASLTNRTCSICCLSHRCLQAAGAARMCATVHPLLTAACRV